MNSFPGQAILPGNVQRQREVAVEVVEAEATFATAATGFYFAIAASLRLITFFGLRHINKGLLWF